jgi:poly(beta-D-mannuronate) lyase
MRLILSLLCLPLLGSAKDHPVSTVAEFEEALRALQPGDAVVLREGEWPDAVLKFKARGTAEAQITLRAAVPGKTVLSGRTQLKIGGEHLVVEGLQFKNPSPEAGDTIEFRIDSKTLASHCRLTNCAVIQDDAPSPSKESRWIGIYGGHNRMDHCLVQGKTNKGTTVVVWLGQGQEAKHVIEENYFGPREKLGKNGGETIRIGDSQTSMMTAACLVRRNLFDRCNGEAECISNKSCGNVYRDNAFVEVSGTLTLRHGNACRVEGNAFFGNDANGTGGIRIIGEDHLVKDNYLEKLEGDDLRSAITFMLGIPNSAPHGYFQVKRARVEGNTIVECEHPILIGQEGSKVEGAVPTLPPIDCVIAGNVVQAPKMVVVEARCDISGIKWENNHFFGKELGIPERDGIVWKEAPVKAPAPLTRAEVGPSWGR